ncbi:MULTISPECIES: hypothetical protein [Halomonadaceae]|uniref:hypothetical protein n=1 Tax=Halomonadaceae TaxID=28256 RepID=UPI0012F32AE7|nr:MULTISPECIES: hypothetical protein [Halomonas]CAD5264508.1 conserved hypothetical protein [Halomonas sp. 156]CAD5265681.1 conserved hypothetical protein [Halomonas sp. I3]CAD5284129.1 conserved hypothetical protein [Halomonas sp. 113]CAD5285592.1 conserved hypothetical protein [Halomonas sp. 59]VXB27255.1 conserved hypothetical protein [Halomonas titanicae]
MPNIDNPLEARARAIEAGKPIDELVKTYKENTPLVLPLWDETKRSIEFNNINSSIVEAGIDIYTAPFTDLWNGIYQPDIYDKETLWECVHDERKIAKVIKAWSCRIPLSPIFLVKHGLCSKGVVADGKHRLTVARYMGCESIPFMVSSSSSDWLEIAIPSAKKL